MSTGIRAARARLLGIRQPFRLEANHRLEPDEWSELATYRICLPQIEPADHLIIASVPSVSFPRSITSIHQQHRRCRISKTLWCHFSAHANEAYTNDHAPKSPLWVTQSNCEDHQSILHFCPRSKPKLITSSYHSCGSAPKFLSFEVPPCFEATHFVP